MQIHRVELADILPSLPELEPLGIPPVAATPGLLICTLGFEDRSACVAEELSRSGAVSGWLLLLVCYPTNASDNERNAARFREAARAFGGFGAAVETTAEFAAAFTAAQASGKPAIIHVKVDPEAITPATTISKIREKALSEQSGT